MLCFLFLKIYIFKSIFVIINRLCFKLIKLRVCDFFKVSWMAKSSNSVIIDSSNNNKKHQYVSRYANSSSLNYNHYLNYLKS